MLKIQHIRSLIRPGDRRVASGARFSRARPAAALALLGALAACSSHTATGGVTWLGDWAVVWGEVDGRLDFVMFTDVHRSGEAPSVGGKGGSGTPAVFGKIPLSAGGRVEFLARGDRLEIGGIAYDLARGRVLLVTAGQYRVIARQLDFELDDSVPWDRGEIQRLAGTRAVYEFVEGLTPPLAGAAQP
jgi:hypothetical protein